MKVVFVATEGATESVFPCKKRGTNGESCCWKGKPLNALLTLGKGRFCSAVRHGESLVISMLENVVVLEELALLATQDTATAFFASFSSWLSKRSETVFCPEEQP